MRPNEGRFTAAQVARDARLARVVAQAPSARVVAQARGPHLAAAWAVLLAISCGGGGDESEKPPEERFPARFSEAKCEVLEPCCRDNGLSFDADNCVVGGAGFVSGAVSAAKKAGAIFNAEAADACIAATVRATESCGAVNAGGEDPCTRVWEGTHAPGEACTSDFGCASAGTARGSCYLLSAPGEPPAGVCVLRTTPAAVGDACAVSSGSPPDTLAGCAPSGLWCDFAGKCASPVALGGSCGTFIPCEDGAHCDAGGTDTCVADLAMDAPCTTNAECASGYCLRGTCAANAAGTLKPCTGEDR